jgi:hypothetical protein
MVLGGWLGPLVILAACALGRAAFYLIDRFDASNEMRRARHWRRLTRAERDRIARAAHGGRWR